MLDASWIEPLPDGHQGTWRTLEAMRYLVRKDYSSSFVRSVVFSILDCCVALKGQLGAYYAVAALFVYARDQIRFVDDPPGIEKISDFQRTTEAGCGDCDDKAVWLATALLSQNIPARFVVQSSGGREWDHVYVDFYDWQRWQWIALDPAADGHTGIVADIGWRQPLPPNGYEARYAI